jgi:Lon protease-like protein
MPMFPLGTVLVPHQPLPLHVFEPRYRALVRDCFAADATFGVVLIERGSEVGGGDVRFDVGCTARIIQGQEQLDGQWELATVGESPLRVLEWLPDDPYPLAEVELVEDPAWTADDEPAFDRALASFRAVIDVAERTGSTVDPRILELPGEASWDHWLLVGRAPLGELDRLALLRATTPTERLVSLADQLDELAAVLATRLDGG